MVANIRASLQPTASQAVSRLQCSSCSAQYIGEILLYPPVCPSGGAHTLALVERLLWNDPWWHLLPRVEVRDADLR